MNCASPFNVRTPEMIAFTAIDAEYRDFIWNIATDEPLSGYVGAQDMPDLTDEDRALVLRARPQVLQGIFCIDPSILDRIYAAIRRQVFEDVRDECARLTARKEQIL